MAAIQHAIDPSPGMVRRGWREAAPAWRRLRCGPWVVHFDPAGGGLRALRVEGREALRAIYGAVRDRDWGTVLPRLQTLHIVENADAFCISFEAECVAEEIAFSWRGEIVGDENGVLRFHFSGEALAGFWRNRLGLCVLHPIEGCAGEKCRVETVGGIVSEEMFPHFIAPHQPFRNVRAITHGGVEVRFEGEVFETEDQRNWTDASFKTYGTPLAEPFPVWIERGTRVEQSVTVRLLREPSARVARIVESEAIPELSLTDESARPLPPVGFGVADRGLALTPREVALLQRLRPAHLRVDLRPSESGWPVRWRMAAADAAALGAALHVALFLTDDEERELAALAAEVAAHPAPVALWLIFHAHESVTDARWLRMAEAALPGGPPFAAGTDANFAELNRARPAADETALPCFSINPQVHAFDDASLMENLGAQAATVESARQFAPRPVVISPITLHPRSRTPNADARQASLFAAAWTTGSLARLAALDGLHSLTYFETTGCLGVMDADGVFPMFQVFAALAEGASILPTRSTQPLVLDGFCIIGRDGLRQWSIANLTAVPRRIRVAVGGSSAGVRILDETSPAQTGREPENFAVATTRQAPDGFLEIELNPYACAQITVES